MPITALDHVSLAVRDLERSIAYYRDVLGLHRITRPAFKSSGAWMASGMSWMSMSSMTSARRKHPLFSSAKTGADVREKTTCMCYWKK